jgi:hypothetical protein
LNIPKFSIDKDKIITPAKLLEQRNKPVSVLNEVMKGSGFSAKEIYTGVEDTVLERSFTQEFEFDGFSVVVEDGKFGVQFEDPEDGLVVQYLAEEGENEIKFPYLFEVDGVEKILAEEDYQRIRAFVEKGKL